jgi:hypothetical protein
MSASWHGSGKTLRESVVGQSLLESFNELDIGVPRKQAKSRRTTGIIEDNSTSQENPHPKRTKSGQEGEEGDAQGGAQQGADGGEEQQPPSQGGQDEMEKRFFENLRLSEVKERLVAQRRAAIKAARAEFDESKFVEEDIYYALLVQGAHASTISLKERESFKKKNDEGSTVMVASNVVPANEPSFDENGKLLKDVKGKIKYMPPIAKRDVELSLPVNRCMAKRMLYPKEPVAVSQTPDGPKESLTTTHSEVNLNFVVFADEKDAQPGRKQYQFKFGEGTGEIPQKIAGDPDAVLRFRRSNLFRYGSGSGDPSGPQYEDNFMELSSKAMHLQDRKLGYPLFAGSDFVDNTKYTAADGRPLDRHYNGLPDLDDLLNSKRFHRAMRYKFEVMRLWWKMFNNQQERIYFRVLREGGLDRNLAKIKDMTPAGWDALYDETSPRMVLAVIERGREGALFPGNIYPRYDEGDMKDGKYLFVKRKVEDDEFEQLSGTESKLVQPVQRIESHLWPLVTPAKTRSWLAWTTEIEATDEEGRFLVGKSGKTLMKPGIIAKNEDAWTIMNTTFGINNERLDIDYDDMWASPPEEFTAHIFSAYGSDDSSVEENKIFGFEKMSQVADDIIDAMPFWTHAYLCEALVKKEPGDIAAVDAKKDSLQKQIDGARLNIRVENEVFKNAKDAGKRKEARDTIEAKIYLMEVELARKINQLKAITDDDSTASIKWAPYASNLTRLRERNDSSARFALTWAQEQLQRCVINVWKDDKKVYSSEVVRGFPPPLDYFGHLVVEGTVFAADYFRQWFYEVYLGLGENGIGMEDQLVIMTNLIDGGKPVLKSLPGTVQLQGHMARILSKKPRPTRAGDIYVVDKYVYVLETDFLVTKTNAVELDKLKEQNKVSRVNTVIVELTGAHIWPLCYNSRWRYGDVVEYRPIEPTDSVTQAKADGNNKLWRGAKDLPQPWQWVVVERPYYAPPEEFTAMGWGTYSLSDTSFKHAPTDAKDRVSTIGQIVISFHVRDAQVRKDDYMRFPLPVNKEGNLILAPLDKKVSVPADNPIATLVSTRVNSAGKTVKQALREGRLEFVSNKSEEERLENQENDRKRREELKEADMDPKARLAVNEPTKKDVAEALRRMEQEEQSSV